MWNWFSSPPKNDIEELVKRLEKTRIERELAIREAIVERKNAYTIAEARERLRWIAVGGIAVIVGSVAASIHHKKPSYSVVIAPTLGYMGYEAYRSYGKGMEFVFKEMDKVFNDTSQRLSTRLISVKEIDSRIADLLNSPEAFD